MGGDGELDRTGEQDPKSVHGARRPRRCRGERRRVAHPVGGAPLRRCRRRTGDFPVLRFIRVFVVVSSLFDLLSVVPDVGLRAEFGKVFGPGEHRRERLPSPWFWYASVALGSRLLCYHVFA